MPLRWTDRHFTFNLPEALFPVVVERLRGTPARLKEMLRGVPGDVLVRRRGDKWSPQEHAGHLLDLEPLWMARLEDFLRDGDTLTVADLSNRKTHEANHNARELEEILAQFTVARLGLADRAAKLQPEFFARSMLHPRLKQPMRLVDHLYFVAEHDDHHLARIWEVISTGGSGEGAIPLSSRAV